VNPIGILAASICSFGKKSLIMKKLLFFAFASIILGSCSQKSTVLKHAAAEEK
jgi:uncharacterized lipoprotein YajG